MTQRSCLSIILAAGEGTRMRSARPKVMHEVAGLPMVSHVVLTAKAAGSSAVAVVVGREAPAVEAEIRRHLPDARTYLQQKRLGTAHAVLAARKALEQQHDDLLVMFGDTPLVQTAALDAARTRLAEGADVVVFGFRPERPDGYGRLIEADGRLVAIREDRDCTDEEKRIGFCNGGLMALSGAHALALLDSVRNENAKGEFYLTDVVAIGHERGLRVEAIEVDGDDVLGVNTRVELAEAEAIWQARARRRLMLAGVTMLSPETVFLSHDTEIGPDSILEPNVFFGPGVRIGQGARVLAFSHLAGTDGKSREGVVFADDVEVGPFARIRPGTDLADHVKVGNFVEIKNTRVEDGAKVPHLTYLGDARIGAGANIGAGTITCNYDGFSKARTVIGEGAFVGSNSSLVAPVTVGARATIAAGSVITESVPDDALAFGRARQKTLPGKGKELRERLASAKAAAQGKSAS
jgi:bifunctional UDP-N-acetylglucosamine pyrophosphorylase/glucosamine-1-phosphate N-acetyltransferase